jgi:hypothetical protein
MKKIKLLLLIACTLSVWQMKGQTGLDCNHPILIPQPYTKVFGGNSNETWYNFNATSVGLQLDIFESTALVNVSKIELYAGNCSTLTLLAKDSLTFNLDSIKTITFSGLTINSNYYIKVSFITNKITNNYKLVLSPTEQVGCGFSYWINQTPTNANINTPTGNYFALYSNGTAIFDVLDSTNKCNF